MNCEFCGKTFKSNKTLSNHKSSSLSCSQKHKQKELSIPTGDVKENTLLGDDKKNLSAEELSQKLIEVRTQLEFYKTMALHSREVIESLAKQHSCDFLINE
jgi:hypothetical protein